MRAKKEFVLKSIAVAASLMFAQFIYAADNNSPWTSFCGDINVVGEVKAGRINAIIDSILSLKSMIEPSSNVDAWVGNVVSCNLPGSDFQICRACQDEITKDQMAAILPMLTDTKHRKWHDFWHRMWNFTYEIDLDPPFEVRPHDQVLEPQTAVSFKLLTENGWLPRSGVSKFIKKANEYDGESFLYMHRQMIKMVNLELTANGLSCIKPWKSILPMNHKIWPVPQLIEDPRNKKLYEERKQMSDHLRVEFQDYSSESYLKTVTLDQLGYDINMSSFHGDLHDLYSDSEEKIKSRCQGDEMTSKICDNLGSNVSSHVNKHFWKLHGLIDDLIGKWLKANGYQVISENCNGKNSCYQWKGTYLGKVPKFSHK